MGIFNLPDIITNSVLAKIFTVEFLLSAVVAIFVLGGLWGNINKSIADATEVAEDSGKKVIAVEQTVNEIQTDVAVIKINQIHAADRAKDQSKELSEQRKDIKKILTILGNANEHGQLD